LHLFQRNVFDNYIIHMMNTSEINRNKVSVGEHPEGSLPKR
jgi:hypothetical protein